MFGLLKALRQKRRIKRLERETAEETFSRYYARNSWGDRESASGKGSNLAVTAALRAALPGVFARFGVKSLLDVPCGDFNWMSRVDMAGIDYTGGDIVPALIADNTKRHGSDRVRFTVINLMKTPLPHADMIFTRDCLVHLSLADASAAVSNIRKSGATYLMATNFPSTAANADILTGQWRPLDLCKPPFNFPEPLHVVDEKFVNASGQHSDKCMGIWTIADLPEPTSAPEAK
ncbi:MAG: class I SAM-dependent methyltransferase [Rhodobacteraceae bacterium]|nr:class I SAM-dependent methyltransferase [Paracoccaceae bacterium]